MRLKQTLLAALCAATLAGPVAFAQSTTAPVVARPVSPTPAPAVAPRATPAPAPTPATTPGPAVTSPMTMTNINTASGPDLDKLPGIGKARLAKIIANRPYKTTDELLSKKVIPKSVYDKLKDKITVG